MVGNNNTTNNNFIPQRLLLNNGLEFFCGDMVFSDKIIIGSNRPNWGESNSSGNSVIYQQPLLASSNYQQQDQGVRPSEECALEEYSTIATIMRRNNSNTMLHV
ncbi:hypothetical protein PIB30_044603 [Stylosanthes scabra]|uniref:Uncharacterized protein n=1 Tax=Stylosanthes scabra TaxID=79078 RepID=A0ABU6RG80_9FABA|nr:hypothetical protein [Stylosanthes scabra]